jgi:hypothetical protein
VDAEKAYTPSRSREIAQPLGSRRYWVVLEDPSCRGCGALPGGDEYAKVYQEAMENQR